ncbi:hypothetical protein OTB20_41860, partial [Streptomyces sp. H27-H1]|nr:hypothetical protein [Streptomyces sp. H27-H1]
ETWNPGAPAALRDGPTPDHTGQIGRNAKSTEVITPQKDRGQYRPQTLDGFIAGTGLTLDDPTSPDEPKSVKGITPS